MRTGERTGGGGTGVVEQGMGNGGKNGEKRKRGGRTGERERGWNEPEIEKPNKRGKTDGRTEKEEDDE